MMILKDLGTRVGREENERGESFMNLTLFASSPLDFPLKNLQNIVFQKPDSRFRSWLAGR